MNAKKIQARFDMKLREVTSKQKSGAKPGSRESYPDSNLHMMSHSLAFQQIKEDHKKNASRDNSLGQPYHMDSAGEDSNSNHSPNATFNSKTNVHMNALRPRTFDPMTMKSARRKINLQKH